MVTNMRSHVLHKHSGRMLHCPKCEYQNRQKANMIQHMKRKHTKLEYIHQCPDCDYSSKKDIRDVQQHYEKKHMKKTCIYCNESFKHLSSHIKNIHQVGTRKKQKSLTLSTCVYCGVQVYSIYQHVKDKHTGVTQHCPKCEYESRRKDDLDQHYKRMHTEENNITCHLCGLIRKDKRHQERCRRE